MTLGIIVSYMGRDQLSHHIGHSGSLCKSDDLIVFFENITKPWIILPFTTMNISEAYDFRSPTIATSLITAERLLHFPGPTQKYFYVWDLEWLRSATTYEEMSKVYNNERLSLIARSDDHAKVIKDAWNRDVSAIVEDCDVSKLLEVVRSHGKK